MTHLWQFGRGFAITFTPRSFGLGFQTAWIGGFGGMLTLGPLALYFGSAAAETETW